MRKLSDFLLLLCNFFLTLACILIAYSYWYLFTQNESAKYALQSCIVSCILFSVTDILFKKVRKIEKRKREKEIRKVVDSIGQPDG